MSGGAVVCANKQELNGRELPITWEQLRESYAELPQRKSQVFVNKKWQRTFKQFCLVKNTKKTTPRALWRASLLGRILGGTFGSAIIVLL